MLNRLVDIKYALVTKREINMGIGQYPAILTEQGWSIKDLLYGQKNSLCGNKAGNPESAHLAARVANQNTGFASSCPLAEPAM